LAGPAGLVALLVGSAAYGSIKYLLRQQRYREVWSSVEAEIGRTIAHPPAAVLGEALQRGVSRNRPFGPRDLRVSREVGRGGGTT
jgi:hypothetical protein